MTADLNPYYHSASDLLDDLNLDYFTAYVQASVGTVAHLAEPLPRLSGRVTDASSGSPLADTALQAVSAARAYTTLTAASGLYTLSVPPAAYDLRAWKLGYTLETLSAVPVYSDTVVDLALTPAQPYTLTGCLTDAATGQPLSATVTAQGPLGGPLGDAPAPLPAGCYTLPLSAGPYTLTAQAPLHLPLIVAVDLAANAQQDFALSATSLNGRVFGRLTGPGLQPLPGLVVQAGPGHRGHPIRHSRRLRA